MTVVGSDALKLVRGDEYEITDGKMMVLIRGDQDVVVKQDKRERVEGASHLKVRGKQNRKIDGKYSLTVGKDQHVKITKNHALDASKDIHLKAGSSLVIEAAQDLTLEGPGRLHPHRRQRRDHPRHQGVHQQRRLPRLRGRIEPRGPGRGDRGPDRRAVDADSGERLPHGRASPRRLSTEAR